MAQSKLDSRYTFVVEYEDPQANITRQYQLLYYLSDMTIEMYDTKNRRMFLKRCAYPSLMVEDLFLGATVVVYSRQLKVVEYGDEFTRKAFQQKSESALGIIAPEGYERMGDVIKRVNKAGMRIMDMNMVQLNAQEVSDFFSHLRGQAEYRSMVSALSAYPVVLLHMVGESSGGIESLASINGLLTFPGRGPVDIFFGPNATAKKRNNAALSNCTLCLIKPHVIHTGNGGDIISGDNDVHKIC
jgi:nucleoside-diphosphate kinase